MWKYISPLLLLLALVACHSSKKSTTNNVVVVESYLLPDTVSASPAFRLFWEEWNNELQQAGVPLAEYSPSEDLAQRYALRKSDEGYSLTGFLHTHPDFNADLLVKLGGSCVAYTDGIYTFAIPVKELPQFITLPGIKYIESALPVHLRKPNTRH